eukprot:scaffold44566_cov17-Tisochrysis_lutea.AAC.1
MGPAVGFVANVGWSAAQLGGRAAWYGGELACKAAYYGGTAAWNGSKAAWNGGTSVWAGIRKELLHFIDRVLQIEFLSWPFPLLFTDMKVLSVFNLVWPTH